MSDKIELNELSLNYDINISAMKHNDHNLKIISKNTKRTKLPWRKIVETRFLCKDCKLIFTTKNYVDDQSIKDKKTSGQVFEEEW